jgi:hypothetical protein
MAPSGVITLCAPLHPCLSWPNSGSKYKHTDRGLNHCAAGFRSWQQYLVERFTKPAYTLPAGSEVHLCLAVANIEDSDEIEVGNDYRPRRHWTFGGGPAVVPLRISRVRQSPCSSRNGSSAPRSSN